MIMKKVQAIVQASRPNQWVKNLVIFTSIIFAGKLFDEGFLLQTIYGFIVLSALSSTSYILNDIVDYPYDRKHPTKKKRPIASGALSIQDATFVVFSLSFISLLVALWISVPFFFISLLFLVLHFLYSLYFKFKAIFDIFAISFSFMLRAFAGQVLSGYHIQIWLLLTIFFISLFIASIKRHAELVVHGKETRFALIFYHEHFLNFLSTTFATLTITTYSLYTFLERPPLIDSPFSRSLAEVMPSFEARKWFMVTIPLVVYGISRYTQLLFDKDQGEAPEKIITRDKPLMFSVALWGVIVVALIYIF